MSILLAFHSGVSNIFRSIWFCAQTATSRKNWAKLNKSSLKPYNTSSVCFLQTKYNATCMLNFNHMFTTKEMTTSAMISLNRTK